jgi:osmotically-inducible protein OsmY
LMGIVTEQEAAQVVQKVRYVSGVKRVIKIFEYQ